jgi:hypothetical protein
MNHQPVYRFSNVGPAIIGFTVTQGAADEVASRRYSTELILRYAEARGWRRPTILPTASREALFRSTPTKSILVVPSLRALFQRPSHITDLIDHMLRHDLSVHCVESGGDISPLLGTLRQVAACFAPMEEQLSDLNATLLRQAEEHQAELDLYARDLLKAFADKKFGLLEQAENIKSDSLAKAATVAARRRQAAQFLKEIEHVPNPTTKQAARDAGLGFSPTG